MRTMKIRKILSASALLALLPLSGLAAGQLAVTQENFYPINSSTLTGSVFARVENTGDAPVQYSNGILDVQNGDGISIGSTSRVNAYARYLAPGEYSYVKASAKLEDADIYTDAASYSFAVYGKSSEDSVTRRLPCEGEYEENVEVSKFDTANYLCATVSNNTDEPIFESEVVLALLDADGNILDIESVSLTSSVAIMPGSSIRVRKTLSDDNRDAFLRAGRTPCRVDAIAYYYEDL